MRCDGGADEGGHGGSRWCWAGGSAAQLVWGISSYLRGYAGDSRLMPIKAFGVASLFVGSAASASIAALQAYVSLNPPEILQVEDLMEVGANMRTRLGVPPRAQVNKKTDDP